ncbi:type II secretion system protein M [Spectribacter hydrogenoxidans]|uniref:Type II secretion system protein M n=1 Tax=Spectribacter hydrogenoxidans TaxID=3075608 RepID=A0ABU3C3R0_9GAMM|nr:type II secretion system protein M [Salinisphaera sp. W335]MDT0636197.1 type II secretion system protein M [Salinisphaera sp. W335]
MKQWLNSLAPRERLLVLGAGLVVLGAVFFLAVWEPLYQGSADLETEIERDRELAGWVAGLKDEAQRLRQQASRQSIQGRDDSLLSVIDQTSRERDLGNSIQRIQPEGDDQAAVTVNNADFNTLLQWLRELQQRYGVTVEALTVSRSDDSDGIEARMTLQRSTE